MQNQENLIPAVAVKGIATGLIMMGCFTLAWTGRTIALVLIVFPVFSGVFITRAITLFPLAKIIPRCNPTRAKRLTSYRMGV